MKNANYLIYLILIMCSVGIAVAAPNDAQGTLQVFTLNASEHTSVPDGIYVANKGSGNPITNVTVGYNETLHSIDYTKTAGQLGELFIGKLTPYTTGNISMQFSFDRTTNTSELYFYNTVSYTYIQKDNNNGYKFISIYTNDTGSAISTNTFTVPASALTDGKVTIHLDSYDYNRTNVLWFNDTLRVSTPYRTISSRDLNYPVLIHPVLYVEGVAYTGGTNTMHIYNITQTIPRYTVTPYSVNNETAFGLDYPYKNYTEVGTAYMKANGQVGTVWADPYYTDSVMVDYTKDLLEDGWELGIHFTPSLTSLEESAAEDEIDAEISTIHSMYGSYPTSWCSLQNGDNVTHAGYIYTNYGAVWRNGPSGISMIGVVGNIYNDTDNWWNSTASNATVYPTFTHRIDVTPAIAYSLDGDKFIHFSDLYKDNGVDIVGFNRYYNTGIVQNTSTVNIISTNETITTFTVDVPANTGMRVNVKSPVGVNYIYNDYVLVPSTAYAEGRAFTAIDGVVYTASTMPLVRPPTDKESMYSDNADTWITAIGIIGVIVVVIFIAFAIGAIQGKVEMSTLVNAAVGLMILMLVIVLGTGVLSKLAEVF